MSCAGKTVVCKYGGHSMADAGLNAVFARKVSALREAGLDIVIGHGGGPQINALLKRLAIPSEFKDGLRKTSAEAMIAVEMALAGEVNTWLVSTLAAHGVPAVGLTGKDCAFMQARRHPDAELGCVGDVVRTDPKLCRDLLSLGYVPVVAPIGCDADDFSSLNINADTASGALAGALRSDAFVLFTDVPGVLDGDKNRLAHLSRSDAEALIADGTIAGGMIPKVRSCLHALAEGCMAAAIFDGGRVADLDVFLDALLSGRFDSLPAGTVLTL